MGTIAVIGSINMDVVIRCSRMPKEGESLIGSDLKFIPGGKGANQALAVKRMGGEVKMAGRLGQDEFGRYLRRSLELSGIDTSQIIDDETEKTGVAVIMVLENGNNSIIVAPGANRKISTGDANKWFPLLEKSDIIILQLEIPLEIDRYIIERCQKFIPLLILDAGPAMKCPREIIAGVDIISPNETEAESITGITVDSLDSAKRAAQRLLEMGAKTVVLKLGAMGSLLADKDQMIHFPTFKVKAIDPTAAGDAFTGALAVKLSENASIDESIKFANAAGALTTAKMGAQPSIPTRTEVEEFIKRHE